MTDLFGRLAPGVDLDAARAELRAAAYRDGQRASRGLSKEGRLSDRRGAAARSDHLAGANRPAGAARGVGAGVRHRVLERRQPDPRAVGAARRRARDPRGARRQRGRAAPHAAGGEPGALRRRRRARRRDRLADGRGAGAVRGALLGARAGPVGRCHACCGSASALALVAAVLLAFVPRLPSAESSNGFGLSNGSVRITSGTNRRLRLFAVTQIAASFVLLAGAGTLLTTLFALQRARTGMNTHNVLALHVPVNYERPRGAVAAALQGSGAAHQRAARRRAGRRSARSCRGARPAPSSPRSSPSRATPRPTAKRIRARRFRTVSPGFFASLGVPIIAGRDFNANDRGDSEKVVIVSQSLAQRLFPEPGRGESPADVDRSGHEIHRREHRTDGGSSASPPTSTTRT